MSRRRTYWEEVLEGMECVYYNSGISAGSNFTISRAPEEGEVLIFMMSNDQSQSSNSIYSAINNVVIVGYDNYSDNYIRATNGSSTSMIAGYLARTGSNSFKLVSSSGLGAIKLRILAFIVKLPLEGTTTE